MSWLTNNIVPIASTIGGGVMTAMGNPAGAGLLAGGLSMLGGNSANDTNRQIASDATNSNIKQAKQQNDFQMQMSNTAYQRSQADMKAAGLNPILAGMNQSPSSTPSGASGKAETAHVDNALGQGVSSALAARALMADIESKGSQNALNGALATKALQDTKTSGSSAHSYDVNSKAVEIQMKALAAEASARAAKAGYDFKASGYDAIMSRANRDTGTAKNLKELIKLPNFFGGKSKEVIIDKGTGEILNEVPGAPPRMNNRDLPSGNWNSNLDRYTPTDYSNR